MIEIYNSKNKNFDMNGDITLTPTECRYTVESNNLYEVELIHPYDDLGRWKYIKEDAVLKGPLPNGESGLFKILKPSKNLDNITANCVPIAIYELGKKVLPSTLKIVNKNGQQALDIILKDTNYKGHSDIEAENNCTFFKNNIMEAIAGEQDNTFLKRWGGELQFIGHDIYINSKPGGTTRVAYGFNMQEIELERDMSNLVTRIYPYVTLETTNTIDLPEGYIDSPLINKYSQVYEVYMDFSEYMHLKTDDEDNSDNAYATRGELYEAMRARCLELFKQGIDKPTVSGSVGDSVLKNTLEFKGFEGILNIDQGYLVKIEHTDIGIETEERCSGFVWDMIEEDFLGIKIGINKENSFDLQSDFVNKADYILNPNGTVNSAKLEGIIDALNAKFRALRNVAEEQHVRAMLFEDRAEGSKTRGALCIGTAGFEIASELDSNGEWIWRTFGDGSGFTADEIRTGVLRNLDNSFAIDLNSKGAAKFYNNGQLAMKMNSNALKLFNWGKNTEEEIGGLISLLRNDSNRNPISDEPLVSLLHEMNSAVTIDYRDKEDKTISHSYVEFDKYNNLKSKNIAPIRVNENVEMANNNFYNAVYKANNAIPFWIDGLNVSNFNKDKVYFNVPVAPTKGLEMNDKPIKNSKMVADKVIPFYIGDNLVGKFEGDKFTLNIPLYNKSGQLVLDPSLTQQGINYQDDSTKNLIDKLISVVKAQLGKPYVWGGEDPNTGFDCSGLMQWSYKQIGIDIPRTTYDQINAGTDVKREDLQLGDLVFPSIEHVGMYIGGGKIIHAPHTGDVVKISDIWAFYKARRIIKSYPHASGGGNSPDAIAGDRCSANIIYYVKQIEGFSDHVYLDSVSVRTLGFGLTGAELTEAEGSMVNGKLSEKDATFYLQKFFNRDYYSKVLAYVKSKGVTNPLQREIDAFSSFAYNLGVGCFEESSLPSLYYQYVKSGRKQYGEQIKEKMAEYCHAGGQVLPGLVRRRNEEWKIFSNSGSVAGYNGRPYIDIIGTSKTVESNGGYGAKPY